MERLLARLERRLGRFAIPNLTYVIVFGMAAVFVLSFAKPEFEDLLVLDVNAVKHGQVWRLITYLFLPPPVSSSGAFRLFFMFFALYLLWLMGSNLENEWGSFKYNVFGLVGMIGTTVAALITGSPSTNFYLTTTLFLAFATLFPDFSIYVMWILPVKVKWLALLAGGYLIYAALVGDWGERAAIIAATGNYVLFFSGHWGNFFRSRRVQVRQRARRASMAEPVKPTGGRVCAICGASEDAGADIRVCSCEKCGGVPRNLCLPHARNH